MLEFSSTVTRTTPSVKIPDCLRYLVHNWNSTRWLASSEFPWRGGKLCMDIETWVLESSQNFPFLEKFFSKNTAMETLRCTHYGERQSFPKTFRDRCHVPPTQGCLSNLYPLQPDNCVEAGVSSLLVVHYQWLRHPCLQRKGGLPLPKWTLHPVPLTPLGRIKKGEDWVPGFSPAVS